MKIKKVDFTGKFKGFDEKPLKYDYIDEETGKPASKEFPEIYEFLGNRLGGLFTKEAKDKMRCLEFAKEIYSKKCINLSDTDEEDLKERILDLNLNNIMFGQIMERIKESKKE